MQPGCAFHTDRTHTLLVRLSAALQALQNGLQHVTDLLQTLPADPQFGHAPSQHSTKSCRSPSWDTYDAGILQPGSKRCVHRGASISRAPISRRKVWIPKAQAQVVSIDQDGASMQESFGVECVLVLHVGEDLMEWGIDVIAIPQYGGCERGGSGGGSQCSGCRGALH